MGDEVLVRYGDSAQETATRLLGAADELEMEPYVVRHQPDDGGFRVPKEVADKADLEAADTEAEEAEAEKERQRQIEVIQAERGVDENGDPVENEDQKLTPKQESVKRAEELGVSTHGTKADIDKRIAKAEKKAESGSAQTESK
jgi:hypothetical protein